MKYKKKIDTFSLKEKNLLCHLKGNSNLLRSIITPSLKCSYLEQNSYKAFYMSSLSENFTFSVVQVFS